MDNYKHKDEQRWSQLMASAQQGNESAYRQLLTELGDVIAAYLRSRFGDLDLLEDCVQESLIAIHKARNTYEPKRLFRPWLFAIVRHKSIDVLRKKQRQYTGSDQQTLAQDNSDSITDSFDSQIDADLHCGQLLASLSDKHREAIVLTKLEGLSMREAADQLNISESAMKVRVHRALDASRQLLEAEMSP
ncbi:MAG: sigma-70 family RNA polymerase sigma factor [Pseudomonadota bacterium]